MTNFINKFITTANYLYEELGILVRISNNIKKDLLNSNIIINIDFNEDLINKYYINPKAIIVNVPDNVKIISKKFSGININSYNIIIPEDYELIGFDDKHIYEARIYYKNLHEIEQSIEENQIEIESLIGKNGIINIADLENKLRYARIIDESEIDTKTVQVGNTVKILDIEFDEELEYTIVGSTEVDLKNNKISNESPIGAALIGAKKNQVVEAHTPGGIVKYKILAITKQK